LRLGWAGSEKSENRNGTGGQAHGGLQWLLIDRTRNSARHRSPADDSHRRAKAVSTDV
jgi:hypothetical protein